MTREEVYDKCTEKIGTPVFSSLRVVKGENFLKKINTDEIQWTARRLLPQEAIDAIIDCAVEEAQKKNTRPCSTCIHYVTKDGHTGCECWECEYEGNDDDL